MSRPEGITIVGVARDVRQSGVTVPPGAEVYVPAPNFVIAAPNWFLLARSELPEESLRGAIRTDLRSEEREAAVDRVRTMDDVIAETVSAQRIVAALLASFGVLALVLASLGLDGLLSFAVAARLPEFAIRAALGSTPRALIARVGREGIALVAVGCAIGLAVMVPLQPLLKRFVFDVGPLSVALGAAVFSILFCGGSCRRGGPSLACRANRSHPDPARSVTSPLESFLTAPCLPDRDCR